MRTVKQPIRYQLLFPLLAALVTAVASIAVSSAWINWSREAAALQQRQDEVTRVLEEAAFPLTSHVLQQVSRLSGQQFVVWDSAARRIVASSWHEMPPKLTHVVAQAESSRSTDQAIPTVEWAGDRYAIRVTHLKHQPGVTVLVLTSQRALSQAQWDALWPPLGLGGGALALLVPWLLALTRRWSRRIERIQQLVTEFSSGDLSHTEGFGNRDDEFAALEFALHQMHSRLKTMQLELIQSERERLVAQLAAGFAHQFRNGVAGASLALQLHASRCASATDPSLAVAQKQLHLLEAEIRGTLSLANRSGSRHVTLCVTHLIDECLELMLPALEHRHIHLSRVMPANTISLRGSRDGLRAALLNLLLNAVDAAGCGGEVRVEVVQREASLSLAVGDNGPGPSSHIAQRLGEAFVTNKPEGIGLGLTVVNTVVKDHGGRLNWRRDNGWTIFEMWLPLPDQGEV